MGNTSPCSSSGALTTTAASARAAVLTKLAAPNFFILGAAKCGTTSLHHALKQHPQIHLPQVKEPSFFSSDFQVVTNPIDYFNLFPEQPGKKRYGEASHVYFSAPEAAPVLRQLFPEARFILILRDPVTRRYRLLKRVSPEWHLVKRLCDILSGGVFLSWNVVEH